MDKNSKTRNVNKIETEKNSLKLDKDYEYYNSQFIICVRARPLNQKELKYNNIETIRVVQNNSIAIVDNVDIKSDLINKAKEKYFTFDYVFDKNATQDDVFNSSIKDHIYSVIEGYNLTVFAYGPTGTGKTFTMLGTGDSPGVMPKSIIDLFQYIEEKDNLDFKIVISYIEVYNETMRDLLSSSQQNIDIRDDPKLGCVVVGAKEIVVNNTNEVFTQLLKGNKNRTTEATNSNEESSRSHALLNISVENKDKSGKSKEISVGKFMLVDLAGSERLSNTIDTQRMIESGNINKSLLTLGSVINALVDQSLKKTKLFIPWRDSKLTRILKNSLGGNAKIIMIANISPSILNLEETMNTLKYANRAKNIKINVKKNVIQDVNSSNFDHIIEGLKSEIENLRHQLAVKTHNNLINNCNLLEKVDNYSNQLNKQEVIQNKIAEHFQEEMKYCKEVFDDEHKLVNLKKDLQEKQYELFQFEKVKKLKHGSQQQLTNINKLKVEIDYVSNQIDEKKSIYINEVKVKREDLNMKIKKILEKDSVSGKNLSLQFEYNCVLIENITLEHTKKMKLNEMKKKNFQINKLVNQLKLRDEVIENATAEMKKNKVKVEIPEEIKDVDEMEIDQSMILPMIVNKSVMLSNNEYPSNHMKTNSDSFSKNSSNNKLPLINSYGLQKTNNARYSPTASPRNHNYNYSNPLVNKPMKTFNTKTNNIIQMLKQNQLSNLKMNMINSNFANSKLQYINNDQRKKPASPLINNNYDHNKLNVSLDHSTDSSSNSFSIAERHITKKAKNVLRTNFLSRYKNSPYIKNN